MEIKVTEYGNATVLSFIGEFYLSSIKHAETIWNEVLKKTPHVIGLDCKKLEFIDSSAIGTLVKFLNNSVECDISLVFFGLNPSIVKLFTTTKLNRIFKISSWEQFKKDYIDS